MDRSDVLLRHGLYGSQGDSVLLDVARLAALLGAAPLALVVLSDTSTHWVAASWMDAAKTPFSADAQALIAGRTLQHVALLRAVEAAELTTLHGQALRAPERHGPGAHASDLHDHSHAGENAPDGADIGFLAVAPLMMDTGVSMGAVCVVDFCQRSGEPTLLEGLQLLARQLVAQILARRPVPPQTEPDSPGLCDWQLEAGHDALVLSTRAARILGVKRGPGRTVPLSQLAMRLQPRQRERVLQAFSASQRNHAPLEVEFDLLLADGHTIRIAMHGHAVRQAQGGASRLIGALQDVTGTRRAMAELRAAARRSELLSSFAEMARSRPHEAPEALCSDMLAVLCRSVSAAGAGVATISDGRLHPWRGFALVADAHATVAVADREGRPMARGSSNRSQKIVALPLTVRQAIEAGTTWVQDDLPAGTAAGVEALEGSGLRAFVCASVPLDPQVRGLLEVHCNVPRRWESDEVELIELAAERIWFYVDRARLDSELRHGEQRFRMVADLIPQLAWMATPAGELFWFNQRWFDYTGADSGDFDGAQWHTYLEPESRERTLQSFAEGLSQNSTGWERTVLLRRRDGVHRGHLARALPLKDGSGENMLWFGTFTDVTEQIERNDRREAMLRVERTQRELAEHALRLKDEFVATVSHELRTPLTAILGWAQVLGRLPGPTPMHADGVAAIERNARAQARMIDDLLDMSHIVAGRVKLDAQPSDPAALVQKVIESVAAGAMAKGVQLHSELADDVPAIMLDRDRMSQVVQHLLSNAIKFTPASGQVRVTVRNAGGVEIEIRDDGEGIDPAFLPHVFSRFTQADGSRTRRFGGLGVGLAIVQRLVEMHGGTVSVQSAGLRQGACFVVHLPAVAPEVGTQAAEPPPAGAAQARSGPEGPSPGGASLSGARILVVDDQMDNRIVLRSMLEHLGAQVSEAESAREALALLSRSPPDVLVTDIGMPDEDGYALLQAVRGLRADQGAQVPAVALTAHARAEDRERALLAGFSAHVPKPIDPDVLLKAILQCMEVQR